MLKNIKNLLQPAAQPQVEAEEESSPPPPSPCPACGTILDAATKVAGSGGRTDPKPGDLSICIYCSAALEFTKERTVRLISEERWAGLPDGAKLEFIRLTSVVPKETRQARLMKLLREGLTVSHEAK